MGNIRASAAFQCTPAAGGHPPTSQNRSGTMGLFSKDIKTIDDLFVHTLRDIYYAENQILKALPDMVEKASDPQLREAFEQHLGETENQVRRLEKVFELHGVAPKGVNCPADGILSTKSLAKLRTVKLDAALIASAQPSRIMKSRVWHADRLGEGVSREDYAACRRRRKER
jgi:hypothetical protein